MYTLLLFVMIGALVALFVRHTKKKERMKYLGSGPPDGFLATHKHQNIAIDANSATLWARDETGISKTINRSEILLWSVESKTISVSRPLGTPRLAHSKVKLLITTNDIDHPVYRVLFKDHSDSTFNGGDANLAEAETWSGRLTAFCAAR